MAVSQPVSSAECHQYDLLIPKPPAALLPPACSRPPSGEARGRPGPSPAPCPARQPLSPGSAPLAREGGGRAEAGLLPARPPAFPAVGGVGLRGAAPVPSRPRPVPVPVPRSPGRSGGACGGRRGGGEFPGSGHIGSIQPHPPAAGRAALPPPEPRQPRPWPPPTWSASR